MPSIEEVLKHHSVLHAEYKPSYKIHGFAVDESNSNSSTCVTYIEDSLGLTPATNNVTTFNGGSWLDEYPFNAIRIVALDNGGNVIGEVMQDNFNKFTDGTDTTNKNLFVEIPPVYWKFTQTANGYEVRWSGEQVDADYKAMAHSRGGTLKGNLYIAVYKGYRSGNVFSCSTGKTITNSVSLSQIREAINSTFGATSGFEPFSYYSVMLLQILFVSMFKTLNSQSIFQGRTGGSAITTSGNLNLNGLYYGSSSSASYAMKFMGIEHLWGSYSTLIDGILVSGSGQVRINDKSVTNVTTSDYQDPVSVVDASASYIKSVVATTEAGFLNDSAQYTTSTTYYTDTQRFHSNYPYFTFGGSYNDGSKAGIFFLEAYWGLTETSAYNCGRLEYLPW